MKRNGQAAPPPSTRVAIYCRQSVSDDLEFGSLDAQREAIEAFVTSQRGEGWVALPERYDDGGYSGANTDRPAFQRLLADIEQGNVNAVAVYKIDRLSRSLLDFARLMDLFEKRGIEFVSVTQQFSTANSIGKLTLNILMSFAEFERQTIAERTRDKMLATRRKGMWTGGPPVLGYDVADKKLVANHDEAIQVREIFGLYLARGSLLATVRELDRRGWTNKTFTTKKNKVRRGGSFNKNSLRALLTNPIYLGKVRCSGQVFDGVHEAIVDQQTWDAVQAQLLEHRRATGQEMRNKWGALLKGLVRCGKCGQMFVHHYTAKGERRYRYYVCTTQQKQGAAACPQSRVAAGELETFVVEKIRTIGRDPKIIAETITEVVRQQEARKPELLAESRRLGAEKQQLAAERKNLLAAISAGGAGNGALVQRLDEIDGQLNTAASRLREVAGELAAIETQQIDEKDLRLALDAFVPVWDELFPREKSRVIRLLIEEIVYDATAGEIEITFRPSGIRELGRQVDRRSA